MSVNRNSIAISYPTSRQRPSRRVARRAAVRPRESGDHPSSPIVEPSPTRRRASWAMRLRKLLEWMKSKGVEHAHVCLEPTSTYHELALEELSADHWVSVVNARAVRHFADAIELTDKTDRIDAMVLAEFCRARRPVATRPLTESERELRELSRRR